MSEYNIFQDFKAEEVHFDYGHPNYGEEKEQVDEVVHTMRECSGIIVSMLEGEDFDYESPICGLEPDEQKLRYILDTVYLALAENPNLWMEEEEEGPDPDDPVT